MREGWSESRVADVAEVLSGFPFKSEFFNESEGIPLIRIRDLQSRTKTEAFYFGEFDEQYIVTAGDFLIGMDGEFRCYEWLGPKALLNQRVCRIQSFDTTQVVPRFIYLMVNQYLEEIENATSYTTVKHISTKQVRDIRFPKPPLVEQKRIVDLVSAVDTYIDTLQQQADVAREARNAVLHELLESVADSPKKKLRELTSKIGSGATPRGGEAVYRESGTTLIRSQNVHDAKFLHEGLVAIDEIAAAALEGVSVQADDVLINITGASVARACLVDKTVLPARVNQHVAILRVKEDVLVAGYLLQFLLGKNMKSHLLDVAGSGTTRQAITKAQLESLEISVPSIEQQIQIVEVVSSMNEVIQSTEQAVSDAKSLRSGLLSNLLSGEHEIPESYDKVLGAA